MKKLIIIIIGAVIVYWGYNAFFSTSDNENIVPSMPERVVACPLCHGGKVCHHCNGDGYRDGRRCNACNGNGKCDGCNGAGQVEVIEINNTDYIQCVICHGSGKCNMCDGTGVYEGFYSETFGHVGGDCMLCGGDGKCISCHGEGLQKLSGF